MPRRLCRTLVAMPIMLGVVSCAPDQNDPVGPSFDRITPGATFEWSVPDRLGPDRDGDGLMDYPRTAEEIRPDGWRVDFDACGIPGTSYQWRVDNVATARVESCTWSHQFPAEGSFQVSVKVLRGGGRVIWAEQQVTVQDWLIISLGDSYASGEGVPEVPQANPELVASFESLLRNLTLAQTQLQLARASLQSAFESKGLAEDVLAAATQLRTQFLNACSDIDNWGDVVACKNFLTSHQLAFEIFTDARNFFNQAVTNATERVNDLTAAYNAAAGAAEAAERAVVDIQGLIAATKNGFVPPVWQPLYANEAPTNENCHRSANAAPARAALALEQADPHTSVTFIHLACTGAKIEGGRHNLLAGQVAWANGLAGDREIDALIISIGGNDAGFANFALACAVQEPCDSDSPAFDPTALEVLCPVFALAGFGMQCDDIFSKLPEPATAILAAGLATLPGRYAQLADSLDAILAGLHAPPAARSDAAMLRTDRVYISEYVDMTKGETGAYCEYDPADLLATMPGFSLRDLAWLDTTAAKGVNDGVEAAAAAHGWNFVSGIHDAYALHGYCAPDHWVVRIYETFLVQGNESGMAHPNNAGQQHNSEQIAAALRADLYPNGPAGAPRPPDAGR